MSREVRRVPPDWQHPERQDGRDGGYQPMFDETFDEALNEWLAELWWWKRGVYVYTWDTDSAVAEPHDRPRTTAAYVERVGGPPQPEFCRPDWPKESRTHWQMYETTSEGTPISPPCATPEELARWLTDNRASTFGNDTATYDQWLAMIRRGYAPSAIYTPSTGLVSGVVGGGL